MALASGTRLGLYEVTAQNGTPGKMVVASGGTGMTVIALAAALSIALISLTACNGAQQALDEVSALAERGDVEAQKALGRMYLDGQDYAEGVRWYRLAADQGDAGAQGLLGAAYANGQGVPQDDAKAIRWWRLAADQGLALAQVNLGVMYGTGRGCSTGLRGSAPLV